MDLTYFSQFVDFLSNAELSLPVLAAYIIAHVLVIFTRIYLCLAYKYSNARINYELAPARKLSSVGQISKIKYAPLRQAALEYSSISEINPVNAPVREIINKHLNYINFMGFKLSGAANFTERLEKYLLFLGIALALVFSDSAMTFAFLATAGFLALSLCAIFFDYNSIKENARTGALKYLEREVAKFYSGYITNAIKLFDLELKKNLAEQNAALTGTLSLLASSMDSRLESLSALNEIKNAANEIKTQNERFVAQHANLASWAKNLETAQTALEQSLIKYETSLQTITGETGRALATFMENYGQEAALKLSEVLKVYLERATRNQENINNALTSEQERQTSLLQSLHTRISDIKDKHE